jgi:hypothetical protein
MGDNSNAISHRCDGLMKAKQSIRYGYGTGWKMFHTPEHLGWWIYGWHTDSEYDPCFLSYFKISYCPYCGALL